MQHDHALWLMQGASAERNVAVRQTALLEAGGPGPARQADGWLAAWLVLESPGWLGSPSLAGCGLRLMAAALPVGLPALPQASFWRA